MKISPLRILGGLAFIINKSINVLNYFFPNKHISVISFSFQNKIFTFLNKVAVYMPFDNKSFLNYSEFSVSTFNSLFNMP